MNTRKEDSRVENFARLPNGGQNEVLSYMLPNLTRIKYIYTMDEDAYVKEISYVDTSSSDFSSSTFSSTIPHCTLIRSTHS